MGYQVLVADDDKLIVKGIKFSLEQDGMKVDTACNMDEAIEKVHNTEYDIVLLDLMMPDLQGLNVCQSIREFSDVPIIMISAKGNDMDRIMGLEYGADDYITKPFNILEVKARMKAVLRRNARSQKKNEDMRVVEYGDLRLELDGRRIFISGNEVNLTTKEFDLMETMVSNPNKIYSREALLKKIWGYENSGDVRTVDVHIRRLREKIEPNPSEPTYVHTKWGVGYYFKG